VRSSFKLDRKTVKIDQLGNLQQKQKNIRVLYNGLKRTSHSSPPHSYLDI